MIDTEGINEQDLASLILGMRAAYARGENAMEYARRSAGNSTNTAIATLIAYDLQAGTYIKNAISNPIETELWCKQIADIIEPYVDDNGSILEVGCGEATTLTGVLEQLNCTPTALGFDISWSRCAYGMTWLAKKQKKANLFVGDLFDIPLENSSIDIVYTSHSLEPNGGYEEAAIRELLRVARRAVVLVEPLYELASPTAQKRMAEHGYVRNLKTIAEDLGAKIIDYRLLGYCTNPLNPSGVVLMEKDESYSGIDRSIQWRCPLTSTTLLAENGGYYSPEVGVAYPVLSGIPLLRIQHAVVASAYKAVFPKELGV